VSIGYLTCPSFDRYTVCWRTRFRIRDAMQLNSALSKSCSQDIVGKKMTDSSSVLLNMINCKIWISLHARSVGDDESCCQF